ncbi:MAG: 4,5-DOPA dioxygenase extradiol [bacterium]
MIELKLNKKIKMPAIFVGHGSPMTADVDNAYNEAWRKFAKKLPKPKAIIVISAHWNIKDVAVSDLEKPKQIYDFYGFPDKLYKLKYPVAGSFELAEKVRKILAPIVDVKINNEWGIDHGGWIPLLSFFPEADVPVVQLSLDYSKSTQEHYDIGKALAPLREEGIMIIGSGDIVHNLREIEYEEDAKPFDWAVEFEQKVLTLIAKNDHKSLIDVENLDNKSYLSVPTIEHYLPLLYVLATKDKDDEVEYFAKGITHGSISMTSFVLK